ncbi:MAG TPA: hypothetical protein VEG36_15490 [Burkholderiales bacterium]|nr:hypothetical protein [Burkholderiales bacterium]
MRGISLYLDLLAEHCPDIRSVWEIGVRADDEVLGTCAPFGWDLIAFADEDTLQQLRAATELHRPDVRLRVVLDGNRFEPAWGDAALSGSLSDWGWKRVSEREAYYSGKGLEPLRPRRRAVRLSEKSLAPPLGIVPPRPPAPAAAARVLS